MVKISKLSNFKTHLARETAGSLYGIVSKEAYDRKTAIQAVTDAVLGTGGDRGLSVRRFRGEGLSSDALLQELEAPSLLVEKVLVIVTEVDKLPRPTVEALLRYCKQEGRPNALVLAAEKLQANTKLSKALQEHGVLLHAAADRRGERAQLVVEALVQKAGAEGKALTPELARALLDAVDGDAIAAENELEKVICYVGDRKKIGGDDVAAVASYTNHDTAWQLSDSILSCNASDAVRVGRSLLAAGDPVFVVLALLRRQVQTAYTVCSILAAGEGPAAVTRAYGYMVGRNLERHCRLAQGYGIHRFRQALMLVDQAVFDARNSVAEPEVLLDRLLIKLTR